MEKCRKCDGPMTEDSNCQCDAKICDKCCECAPKSDCNCECKAESKTDSKCDCGSGCGCK